MLNSVDYGAQLRCQLLLRYCDGLQFGDVSMILRVDPLLMLPNEVQILLQLVVSLGENFSNVRVDRILNIVRELYNHVSVPPALFEVFLVGSATCSY